MSAAVVALVVAARELMARRPALFASAKHVATGTVRGVSPPFVVFATVSRRALRAQRCVRVRGCCRAWWSVSDGGDRLRAPTTVDELAFTLSSRALAIAPSFAPPRSRAQADVLVIASGGYCSAVSAGVVMAYALDGKYFECRDYVFDNMEPQVETPAAWFMALVFFLSNLTQTIVAGADVVAQAFADVNLGDARQLIYEMLDDDEASTMRLVVTQLPRNAVLSVPAAPFDGPAELEVGAAAGGEAGRPAQRSAAKAQRAAAKAAGAALHVDAASPKKRARKVGHVVEVGGARGGSSCDDERSDSV